MILDYLTVPGILVGMCMVIAGCGILITAVLLWAEDRGYAL